MCKKLKERVVGLYSKAQSKSDSRLEQFILNYIWDLGIGLGLDKKFIIRNAIPYCVTCPGNGFIICFWSLKCLNYQWFAHYYLAKENLINQSL